MLKYMIFITCTGERLDIVALQKIAGWCIFLHLLIVYRHIKVHFYDFRKVSTSGFFDYSNGVRSQLIQIIDALLYIVLAEQLILFWVKSLKISPFKRVRKTLTLRT